MYRVYSKEEISKLVFSVNYSKEDVDEFMGGDLFLDHKDLNKDDYIIVENEKFVNPTYDAEKNIIREMTKYEQFKSGLYELQENEVEFEGDIRTLVPGEYLENGEIKKKEKPEGVKIEWNWETHIWEEKASDLEIVEAQYKEYKGMDTPSVLKEMELQDPALATELINMLIELRGIMYSLQSQAATFKTKLVLPEPSEKLLNFKNKFNKI